MKIKTSEMTGAALDWAVAKCEGNNNERLKEWFDSARAYGEWMYSTDWAQAGPIIDREGIAVRKYGDFPETIWQADKWQFKFAEPQAYGPNPLIAAMRCYVASKLGEEVEIPEELLK